MNVNVLCVLSVLTILRVYLGLMIIFLEHDAFYGKLQSKYAIKHVIFSVTDFTQRGEEFWIERSFKERVSNIRGLFIRREAQGKLKKMNQRVTKLKG